MRLEEVVNGTLLGDASIRVDKKKYYYYGLSAKDKRFLKWVGDILWKFNIPTYISLNNSLSKVFTLGFYINARRDSWLLSLRKNWYKQENGAIIKIIPNDLEITPVTLLFWYLGDGCLVRRRNDANRVPTIVLATNCFSKENIEILVKKFKELNLSFYPVEYKSGFTGKKCGWCLYSEAQDNTPYRFFRHIGLRCPIDIVDFSTGAKGIYREQKFFKDKWPTDEDWLKILSNHKTLGNVLKCRREQLCLTRSQLAKKAGVSYDYLKRIEWGKRQPSVERLRKLLEALALKPLALLEGITKL